MSWQLQDAKAKFSRVIQEAQRQPQFITLRGEEKAVVLSAQAYAELVGRHEGGLVEFLRSSPWADTELEIERSTDTGRNVEL